jgi:hypothetical protein
MHVCLCIYTHIIHIHRSVGLLLGRHSEICPLLREWRLSLKVYILYINYIACIVTIHKLYSMCSSVTIPVFSTYEHRIMSVHILYDMHTI